MSFMNKTLLAALVFSVSALAVAKDDSDNAEVESAGRQVYRIAAGAPNRIKTPYRKPAFVTNVEHEAWSVGGVLYLLPMGEEHTMAGFVQDDSGRWAVPVMFEVAKIPPQEITLEDPEFHPVATREGGGGQGGIRTSAASAHVNEVVDSLVEAINHDTIPGFRQMANKSGRAVYVGPIKMELKHVQQRGSLRIETHLITHDGMEPRSISESSFEVPDRLGVVVYPPMTEIKPGEQAHVYIARSVSREH